MLLKAQPPAHHRRLFDAIEALVILQFMLGMCLMFELYYTVTAGMTSAEAGFEDRQSGSPINQFFTLAVYLPSFLFILAKPNLPLRTVLRSRLFWALNVWAILSVAWSIDPELSLRRVIALQLGTAFVLHMSTWFSPHKMLTLLGLFCVLVIIGSTLAVGVPGLGITPSGVHAGKMRGLFVFKNIFGDFLAVSVITFTINIAIAKNYRIKIAYFPFIFLAIIELFASDSKTPLAAVIVTCAAMLGAKFIYLPSRLGEKFTQSGRQAIVWIAGLFSVLILPAITALLLSALGRDMTLSGRTHLWQYAIAKGWDHAAMGVGYKAFWTDKMTFDLRVLHDHWSAGESQKSLTANGHNGFLDAWLDLGFVGLGLFLLLIVTSAIRALRMLGRTRDPVFIWHVGALTYAAFYYITESSVIQQSATAWFLVSYVSLSLAAQTVLFSQRREHHTLTKATGMPAPIAHGNHA